jgi:hypothetical protein
VNGGEVAGLDRAIAAVLPQARCTSFGRLMRTASR